MHVVILLVHHRVLPYRLHSSTSLLPVLKHIKLQRPLNLPKALHRREALPQRTQLERKPGPDLLELHALGGAERVAVAPEEEKVALVVQRHDLPALELGQRGEHRLEEPADGVPQTGDEAVEN